MNLTDEELSLYAIREVQLILAVYIQPGPRDAEKTINDLLSVLDRDDVGEAVDRARGLDRDACVLKRKTAAPPRRLTRLSASWPANSQRYHLRLLSQMLEHLPAWFLRRIATAD
jgi:hypothetical protein